MINNVILPMFALAVFAASPSLAQNQAGLPTPDSIVAASSADEWTAIAPEDLLVMELAPDRDGNERRVVIQLMPAPFSQPWVENIRILARDHWWDGTSVYRVVDNWVTQWGDVSEEKALPEGVVSPRSSYVIAKNMVPPAGYPTPPFRLCHASVEACEDFYSQPPSNPFTGLWEALGGDAYSQETYFRSGWPIAENRRRTSAWPTHCYGSVGVARDLAPDTGTGTELYTVIGHAPRD